MILGSGKWWSLAWNLALLPMHQTLRTWVELAREGESGDVFVNFVESNESRRLNLRFRNVDAPTNVLAFPAEVDQVLGDVASLRRSRTARSSNPRYHSESALRALGDPWCFAFTWIRSRGRHRCRTDGNQGNCVASLDRGPEPLCLRRHNVG